jgi:hypothetical protein
MIKKILILMSFFATAGDIEAYITAVAVTIISLVLIFVGISGKSTNKNTTTTTTNKTRAIMIGLGIVLLILSWMWVKFVKKHETVAEVFGFIWILTIIFALFKMYKQKIV